MAWPARPSTAGPPSAAVSSAGMRGPSLLPYAWWSQLTAARPRAPVRTQDSFGGDAMAVNRQIYKQHQHESDQGRVRESRS
jgi:hypothetical protein